MANSVAPKSSKPKSRQLTIFPRGGKREGAGRKPKGERAMVPHAKRAKLTEHTPVHVTMRVAPDIQSLRQSEPFAVIQQSFVSAKDRTDFRIVHFSVQTNHLHLIVEAHDARALGCGMRSLGVQMASGLNGIQGRSGQVFRDRYHHEVIQSPRQMRHTYVYVLNNASRHGIRTIGGCDPYSSGDSFDGWVEECCARKGLAIPLEPAPCSAAQSWLATVGWRRHALVHWYEVPGRP